MSEKQTRVSVDMVMDTELETAQTPMAQSQLLKLAEFQIVSASGIEFLKEGESPVGVNLIGLEPTSVEFDIGFAKDNIKRLQRIVDNYHRGEGSTKCDVDGPFQVLKTMGYVAVAFPGNFTKNRQMRSKKSPISIGEHMLLVSAPELNHGASKYFLGTAASEKPIEFNYYRFNQSPELALYIPRT